MKKEVAAGRIVNSKESRPKQLKSLPTPAKLNECNHAEDPARRLLERLGWTYAPRDALAAERGGEREVLLKGRLRAALLRLNEWLTESQADRVIFELENINATGMSRNQVVHEYLTYGMPLTVDGPRGRGLSHRPLLRLRPSRKRPQRVRGHHPVPGAPGPLDKLRARGTN